MDGDLIPTIYTGLGAIQVLSNGRPPADYPIDIPRLPRDLHIGHPSGGPPAIQVDAEGDDVAPVGSAVVWRQSMLRPP